MIFFETNFILNESVDNKYNEQYPEISTCYDIYTHVEEREDEIKTTKFYAAYICRQYSILIMLQVIHIHLNWLYLFCICETSS